jgi:Tfp pilus assembly protein PilN
MIRINLSSLAPPRTRRGKRGAAPTVTVPGEGPSTLVMALVVFLAFGAGMYLWWWTLDKETTRLQQDLQRAIAENQRLADVKAKYEASRRKADLFERRVKIIDDLKEAQKGPVNLLDLVATTVNKTDAVWLESMTNDGKNLNFIGVALSPDAVADLMANLRRTGAFKSVEIKETSQDATVKEVQAFKFELICEIGLSNKVQKQS